MLIEVSMEDTFHPSHTILAGFLNLLIGWLGWSSPQRCYLNNAYSLADPPNLTRPVLSLKVAPVFGYLSVVQLACSIQHRFFFFK